MGDCLDWCWDCLLKKKSFSDGLLEVVALSWQIPHFLNHIVAFWTFFRVLMLSLSLLSCQTLCRQVQCLVAAPRWTCRRLSWTPHRTPPAPTYWSSPPLPSFKWPAPATPTSTLISTFSMPPLVSSHSSVLHSLNPASPVLFTSASLFAEAGTESLVQGNYNS